MPGAAPSTEEPVTYFLSTLADEIAAFFFFSVMLGSGPQSLTHLEERLSH